MIVKCRGRANPTTMEIPVAVYLNAKQPDLIHPSLSLQLVQGEFRILAKERIPAETLIMVSPIILGISPVNPEINNLESQGRYHTFSGWLNTLINIIEDNGLLKKDSPNFSVGLHELLTFLHPRSESFMTDGRDLVEMSREQLFEKLNKNGIAGQKYHLKLMTYGNFLNTSCVPNSSVSSSAEEEYVMIRTIQEILPDQELTINYNGLWPIDNSESRQKIWEEYGFVCQCSACVQGTAPSELTAAVNIHHVQRSHCWFCGNSATTKCPECKIAAYCGSSCQLSNSEVHGKICSGLKSAPTSAPAYVSPLASLIPVQLGFQA